MARGEEEGALLGLIGDVIGLLEIEEMRLGLIDALRRAIPSDWVSINDIGPGPKDVWSIVVPDVSRETHERWGRLAHQNPLVARAMTTGDGRVYRLSDVVGDAELHSLEIYREVYGPLGLTHQMAFMLPHGPNRILGVALSRKGRDYTEAERQLAERSRPFLIQAYRNAIAFGSGPGSDGATIRAGLQGLGLTSREAQVIELVARGSSADGIAAALGISRRTAQKHAQNAYAKLGVSSRSEAAARAWATIGAQSASPDQAGETSS